MKLQPPTAKDRQSVVLQWLRLGTELHQQNRLSEAEDYYSAILKAQPNHPNARHLIGVLRLQQGRYLDALKLLKQVVTANPDNPSAHADLGNALGKLHRLEDALASYDRAIALKSDNTITHSNRAAVLLDLQRPEEALSGSQRAISLNVNHAPAHYNHGNALKDLKRYEEALTSYGKALALNPEYAEAYNGYGYALAELKRHGEALEFFNHAIARMPDYPTAYNNLGSALLTLKRPDEALASFRQAIALNPKYQEALYNSANTLRELRRPEEALATYDRALALKPDYADALTNRGIVQHELGNHTKAFASLDAAVALDPENADARSNRSFVALATGNLSAGWVDYEYRFLRKQTDVRRLAVDYPLWTGQPLLGKRILVYEEQGLGDIIQFSRFLPLLAAQGADVTFRVKSRLHRLLQSLEPSLRFVDRLPETALDYQCALMSLPGLFKTTLTTIPATPFYIAAEPDLIAHWQQRIGNGGFKVGVAWQGNPDGMADLGRSYPLKDLVPIARIPGIRLISLQKNHGLEQLANLPSAMNVETLGQDFDSGPDRFIDTAAVMTSLDLVITSDTSIAHLAGALGRPTWLALKHVPDWRWLLDRADSPWYPTMTLYRQSVRGRWSDVFDRMSADLTSLKDVAR